MTAKKQTNGSFLIAAPHLNDPNFSRTVILMAEHSEDGGFGLVVNRPASIKVAKLWETLTGDNCESEARAYVGGPVQSSAVFLLHTCEDLAGDDDAVVPGLYLGNEVELLAQLITRESELRERGDDQEVFRVFCGYSGWGKGQLDAELETGSWLVQKASAEIVFWTPATDIWKRALAREGGVYRLFSEMPPNPELN